MSTLARRKLSLAAALAAALAVLLLVARPVMLPAVPADQTLALETITQLETLVRELVVSGDRTGQAEVPRLPATVNSVYVALYAGGVRLAPAWADAGSFDLALRNALHAAQGTLNQADQVAPTLVELSLAHGFRSLQADKLGDDLTSAHRGVRGLQLRFDDRIVRFAPSDMVARNLSFERALSEAAKQLSVDGATLVEGAELATFEAYQVLVPLDTDRSAVQLFRGNRTVGQDEINARSTAALSQGMQRWMQANLQADGRMTYLYYPASGRESSNNNMIRQWMASLCLVRMARAANDEQLLSDASRNIRHNLRRFYREEDGLGLIEYEGRVKLGAVALAALALLEHPEGEQFAQQRDALVATTDRLWQEDGSFQLFYRGSDEPRDSNLHNFYPGETLLLWATLLAFEPDPGRLQRMQRSIDYYRTWHLAHRKPSFVPWHTQAYYLLWRQSGSAALRDWIFEMNDWLLQMQEHSRIAHDDTAGRFYDPRPGREHFGPPHASSTGVFLEGLVDAYRLAVEEGDAARADRYRTSILQGLRSTRQLQFRGWEDTWFARDPARIRGGIRTTVYNNVIRVDNVQHNLMALLKFPHADIWP